MSRYGSTIKGIITELSKIVSAIFMASNSVIGMIKESKANNINLIIMSMIKKMIPVSIYHFIRFFHFMVVILLSMEWNLKAACISLLLSAICAIAIHIIGAIMIVYKNEIINQIPARVIKALLPVPPIKNNVPSPEIVLTTVDGLDAMDKAAQINIIKIAGMV